MVMADLVLQHVLGDPAQLQIAPRCLDDPPPPDHSLHPPAVTKRNRI
jgi:hypothetical protein